MFSRKQIKILGICALAGFLLAVCLLLFGLLGSVRPAVSGQESKQAVAVLNNYFEAWQHADPAQMYTFLSSADQKLTSLNDYQKQFEEFPVRPAAYQVKNISVHSPMARVELLVEWPDFSTGKSISREEIFYLQKEGGKWKVQESVSLEK
jgi:hypothetical protein